MFECALVGRLSADAELRTSKSGKPYFAMAVAVGNGPTTTWVRVACFGDRAQELAPTMLKGEAVYAEGQLSIERWTDGSGAERVGFSMAAARLEVCTIGHHRTKRARRSQPSRSSGYTRNGPHEGLNDDISF